VSRDEVDVNCIVHCLKRTPDAAELSAPFGSAQWWQPEVLRDARTRDLLQAHVAHTQQLAEQQRRGKKSLIMFLLVATALAGTNIGFPCQRLNWGWRNVWTTCSINSFVPNAAQDGGLAQAPTHFRYSSDTLLAPVRALNSLGVYQPVAAGTVPNLLCANAPATGTGVTANLRNRCRRAIDAYGALVTLCASPLGVRGPNMLTTPDWAPSGGHAPHSNNVQGLTHNAQMCLLPAGQYTPSSIQMNSPSTTCPGLLGWFTVVYNACKFSQAPALNAATGAAPNIPNFFPIGGTVSIANVLNGAPVSPQNKAGYFCKAGVAAPDAWNDSTGSGSSNTFRTSRCRKALDQFGRTASRCASSTASLTGPAQAGGYSDVLRFLAVGAGGATVAPLGINSWAPACNA
jgi:hypothetical protein